MGCSDSWCSGHLTLADIRGIFEYLTIDKYIDTNVRIIFMTLMLKEEKECRRLWAPLIGFWDCAAAQRCWRRQDAAIWLGVGDEYGDGSWPNTPPGCNLISELLLAAACHASLPTGWSALAFEGQELTMLKVLQGRNRPTLVELQQISSACFCTICAVWVWRNLVLPSAFCLGGKIVWRLWRGTLMHSLWIGVRICGTCENVRHFSATAYLCWTRKNIMWDFLSPKQLETCHDRLSSTIPFLNLFSSKKYMNDRQPWCVSFSTWPRFECKSLIERQQ